MDEGLKRRGLYRVTFGLAAVYKRNAGSTVYRARMASTGASCEARSAG